MFNDQYDDNIQRAADKYLSKWQYDWRLLKAQYWQESRLKPDAKSPAGAEGISQFMPKTWKEWTAKTGYVAEHRTSPEASIFVGAAYMDWLMNQWYWERPAMDRIALALASYNAGLGNVLEAQAAAGHPPLYADIIELLPDVTGNDNSGETIEYVGKILTFWTDQVIA